MLIFTSLKVSTVPKGQHGECACVCEGGKGL